MTRHWSGVSTVWLPLALESVGEDQKVIGMKIEAHIRPLLKQLLLSKPNTPGDLPLFHLQLIFGQLSSLYPFVLFSMLILIVQTSN
jgi:hypothetical protein